MMEEEYERFNDPFEKWARTAMGWELKKIKTPDFLLDNFVIIPDHCLVVTKVQEDSVAERNGILVGQFLEEVFGKEERGKSEVSLLKAADFSEESDLDFKGMKNIRVVGIRRKLSHVDKQTAGGESTAVEAETGIVGEVGAEAEAEVAGEESTEAQAEMEMLERLGVGNKPGVECTSKPTRRRDKKKERKKKNTEAQQHHRSSSRSTSRSSSRVADEMSHSKNNACASESSESFPSLSHLINSDVDVRSPGVADTSISKPEKRTIKIAVRGLTNRREHQIGSGSKDISSSEGSPPKSSSPSFPGDLKGKRKLAERAKSPNLGASSGENTLPDLPFIAKRKKGEAEEHSGEELSGHREWPMEWQRALDLSLLPKCSEEGPSENIPLGKMRKKRRIVVSKSSFSPRRVPPRSRNWKAGKELKEKERRGKEKLKQLDKEQREEKRKARGRKVHRGRQKDKKKKIRQISKMLADSESSGGAEPGNSEALSGSSEEDCAEMDDEEVKAELQEILATLYPLQDDIDQFRGRQVVEFRRRNRLSLQYRLHRIKQYRSQLIAQSIAKRALQFGRIRTHKGMDLFTELRRRGEKGDMDVKAQDVFGDHIEKIKQRLEKDDREVVGNDSSVDASQSFSEKLPSLASGDLLYRLAKEVFKRKEKVMGNNIARKKAGFRKKLQDEKALEWQRLTVERLLHTVKIRSDLRLIPEMVGEDPEKFRSADDKRSLVGRKVELALSRKEQARKSFFSVFNGIKRDIETWKAKCDEKEKECEEAGEEFDFIHAEEIIREDLFGERSHRNPDYKKCGEISRIENELCDEDPVAPLSTDMDLVVQDGILKADGSDLPDHAFDDENAEALCLTPMAADCSWMSNSSKKERMARRKLELKPSRDDFDSPSPSKKLRKEWSERTTPSPRNSPLDQFSPSQNNSAVFSSPESVKLSKMPSFGEVPRASEGDDVFCSRTSLEHSTPIGAAPRKLHVDVSPVSEVAKDDQFSPVGVNVDSAPVAQNVMETPFKVPSVPSPNKIGSSTPVEKEEHSGKWIKCTAECDAQIPQFWACNLYSLLECLTLKYSDMMELQKRVFYLSSCVDCVPGQYPVCVLDEDNSCTDAVKQLRKVQLHSSGVRNFIRRIYRLRQINNWMLQLDRILDSGDFCDLLKHIDLSEERRLELSFERASLPAETRRALLEAQKQAAVRRASSIAHVPTIREKWGKLIKNFNAAIEFPEEVCDICHQWVYRVTELKEQQNEDGDVVTALQQLPTSKDDLRSYFEKRLGSAKTIRVCKNSTKHKVSTSCWTYLNHKTAPRLPPLAVENGMEIDEITEIEGGEEFGDLNPLEEMFVKQMTAFLTVVRLKPCSSPGRNAQMYRALKGHGINLPLPYAENLELVSKTMPNLKFLTVLVDGISDQERKIWRSVVRIDKCLRLLRFFKEKNPRYADIEVLDSDSPEMKKMLDEVFRETPPELLDNDNDAGNQNLLTEAEMSAGVVLGGSSGARPCSSSGNSACNEEPAVENEENHQGVSSSTPARQNDPSEAARKSAALPSVRQYTEPEKMNIEVQQYSITTLQSSQPSEKDTELYRKVRVIAEPVADKEPYKEEKIFPIKYPLARGAMQEDPDPVKKRPSSLKPHQFLRGRINNIRGKRFRRDPQWLFYHQNERTKKDINNGVYATMNLSKKPHNMTVRQFLEGIRTGKLENAIANMFGSIKGTKEYWQRRRSELTGLEQKYGPPTWYLTLSCAEYSWEVMARYLRQRSPDLNSESINKLLENDPTGIAQQFKRQVEAMFDKIINAKGAGGVGPLGKVVHFFWRYEYQARGAPHIHCLIWVENAPILKEDMSNKEEVVKFINNHVSCELPDENDEENRELRRLVERFQKHNCTSSCTRTAKTRRGRKHVFCRYHFPRPIRTSTEIRSVKASVQSKMGARKGKKLYELERSEQEQYINDYNPALLLAWKANMDLQYVGDESMVLVKYVTGYVGKHDKGTTGPVWDVANRDPNIRKSLWQYGCDIFRHREIGAIEAADRLLGHCLYKFSPGDSPKFLNTKAPEDKFRRLKKMTEAEGIEDQDNPEGFNNLFGKVFDEDYYPARPKSWENIPMALVFSDWDYNNKDPLESQENVTDKAYPWREVAVDKDKDFIGMYGGSGESDHEEEEEGENLVPEEPGENLEPNDPADDDNPEEPNEDEPVAGQQKKRGRKGSKYVVLKDKDGNYLGRLVQRKKACVTIRSHNSCNSPENIEKQYRAFLLLYKPWRSLDELMGDHSSFESAWRAWAEENPNGYWSVDLESKKVIDRASDLIEKYQKEVETEEAQEAEKPESGENPVDAEPDEPGIPVPMVNDPYEMNDTDLENAISGLNKDQRRVFDKIIYSIHHKEHCMKRNTCSCPSQLYADDAPLRCTVTGVGGTGKSHLIKVISAKLIKDYGTDEEGNSRLVVARIAPTGIAGLNINGKTIHKLLKIHPKNNRLQCERLEKHSGQKVMRALLENVKLFIVDEYSMVSNVLLNLINDRLNEVFPRSHDQHRFHTPIRDLCFGRRNLALFGDILQLKPVNAKYCFEPLSAADTDRAGGGLGIETRLMDQFSYDELEENMRQRGDPEFQEMLARIRLGNLTEEDVKRLKNCEKEFSTHKEMAEYLLSLMNDDPNCLALVPTLDKMDALNEAMLQVKGLKPVDIPAWEEFRQKPLKQTKRKKGKFRVGSASWKAAQTAGLSHNLRIAEGAQVMLRKNLDDDPRVGLVNGAIGTVVQIISSSDKVVQKIVVKFHRTGQKHVIKRVRADYEISQGNYQTVRQFPLCLSYAITIHRCQGVTLESAMIDLTSDGINGIFEDAQSYVALSRVKSFKNVHLIAFGKHAIRADQVAIMEYNRLRRNAGLRPVGSFNDRPAEYRGVGKRFARGETEISVPVPSARQAEAGVDQSPAGETTKFMLLHPNPNHCYVNSLVQGLLGLELLKDRLQEQSDVLSVPAKELLALFEQAGDGKEVGDTAELSWSVLGHEAIKQQDVLDLWNRIFPNLPQSGQSLFEFNFLTRIRCDTEGCPGSSEDNTNVLANELVLHPSNRAMTFQELLEKFCQRTPLQDSPCPDCQNTRYRSDSIAFPEGMRYLLVHLPLFDSKERRMGARKIQKFNNKIVKINTGIRNKDGSISGADGKPVQFETVAALEYVRISPTIGHYRCFRKAMNDGVPGWRWLKDYKKGTKKTQKDDAKQFISNLENVYLLVLRRC